MTDRKKTTEPDAVELIEEDLNKAQGGFAKYDGFDGEEQKVKATRTGRLTDDGGFITPFE